MLFNIAAVAFHLCLHTLSESPDAPVLASDSSLEGSWMARRCSLAFFAIALLLGACSATPRSSSVPLSQIDAGIRLDLVAKISAPVAFATKAGDPPHLAYIAQQKGTILRLDTSTGATNEVASFADRTKAQGERGLLGIAFSPAGDELYAHFTDLDGNTNVVAVRFADGVADMRTSRLLFFQEQPFANHNGGQLLVDSAGNLLLGLGDGGSSGDPRGNAQSRTSLLGKILRIHPTTSSTPSPTSASYTIPADNPFVNSATAPEILFLGLRNPWRFSIDSETGDFWIADVGQNSKEEINHVPAASIGANFGWNVKEGNSPFLGTTSETIIDPIYDWDNNGGSAAIGGFVYRGSAIDGLKGRYVFADFAQSGIFVLDPATRQVGRLNLPVSSIVAFGEDRDGELYVLSLNSGVLALRSRS
ncbi:MAG: PQQ-dependent sugar dehydrogenase [Actinomycetes bacterium]